MAIFAPQTSTFFNPQGNVYEVSFTASAANIRIPPSSTTMSTVKIDNNSGNACFVQFSPLGNITFDHPTPGNVGHTGSYVPNGQSTFLTTGITQPGNVYIYTISVAGTGNIFVQAGV